jgi:N-acyl-D-amino-acid deacylase
MNRAALLVPAVMLAAAAARGAERPCDLLFAGGRVVDGTGAPWFRADVCVTGDRITAIGALQARKTVRRIDAAGLVIAPGFIDMLGQSEYNVLIDNRAASKITQGITTEITGEGHSLGPLTTKIVEADRATYEHYGLVPDWTTLAGYFRKLESVRPAINLGTFVGAGGVREIVLGRDDRPATPADLQQMEKVVAQAMEEGALGLSTSLLYVPDRFATTEEIVALAKVAARYGGSYITHQRDEGEGIDVSLDEVFRIAREAQIPAEIYHLKTAGPKSWGRMPGVLKRIEEARAQGLDVSADQYPWTASSNSLHATLPLWAREGDTEKMLARLRDGATRERIKADMQKDNPDWSVGGASRIMVSGVLSSDLKKYEGRMLDEIAKAESKDPLDALMDIVLADKANASKINFTMDEEDVKAALRHPFVSLGTDSGAGATDGILATERYHPRGWGSTARILGTYVREQKLLPLEEAVRKMTSLPASRMRLVDRGILRPGMLADVVAFDPATVRERATYADPFHYSEGIPYVAVNGQLVVDGGRITAARPGRALRGPGWNGRR